jgi:hypothetical protein
MALLTRDDLVRQSRFAWACLAVLLGFGLFYAATGRLGPAVGTIGAVAGLVALLLPPRERMARLPPRLRTLPRRCDAAPVLGTILSSPGYGLGWFYGPNPYDEIVHLLNGLLMGLVLADWVLQDGRWRDRRGFVLRMTGAGLALAAGWEVFEWATGLIGNAVDTVTDILLTTLGATLGAAFGERIWAAHLGGSATPRPGTAPGAVQQSTAPSERVQKGTGAGGVGWAQ